MQISWQHSMHFVNLKVQISRQAQHLVTYFCSLTRPTSTPLSSEGHRWRGTPLAQPCSRCGDAMPPTPAAFGHCPHAATRFLLCVLISHPTFSTTKLAKISFVHTRDFMFCVFVFFLFRDRSLRPPMKRKWSDMCWFVLTTFP